MHKKGRGKRNSLSLQAHYAPGLVPALAALHQGPPESAGGIEVREESRQVKGCLREAAATLGLPLSSFSRWRKEARTQACSLLGTQGDLQPLDLGLHPSSSG